MPGKDVRRVLDELVEEEGVVEQGVSLDAQLDNLVGRLSTATELTVKLRKRLPADGELGAMTDRDREQASTTLKELNGALTVAKTTVADVRNRLDMFLG